MAVAGGSSFEHAQTGRTVSREEQAWLDGFERTAGSEDDARQAWGHVVDAARRLPALGASLGGALASVVLESVGVPTVLVHLTAASGKAGGRPYGRS